MKHKALLLAPLAALPLLGATAQEKPNIVLLFADDISARELPLYNSSVWSKPEGGNTSDPQYRAKTPVMEQLAREGCWIKCCWSATVSSPSRAQMMTGRYAHIQKWWHNGDCGTYRNAQGRQEKWPLYESSPLMMGKLTQQAGYASYWAGKTQMPHTDQIDRYGFDEGCYTPGDLAQQPTHTDFYMEKVKGVQRQYTVVDSKRTTDTYQQTSYYWKPAVLLINHPDSPTKVSQWPDTPESKAAFGLNTFGADVEQHFIFDFMERKQQEHKPFFIYHTAHLGHDAYNFIHPDATTHWPATPKVSWEGDKYVRTAPHITGDAGVYDTHHSLAPEGMHSHVTYLDYLIWNYMQQFEKMGIADNTIFIFCADNATSKYGKASVEIQKGVHVPMFIYAPCLEMTKQGEQDILVNLADILPTIAEVVGAEIPNDYEINGKSLIPYLTTQSQSHRDWVYSYRSGMQLIRGKQVLRDGRGNWYDVSGNPADLISFPKIKDWSTLSPAHRAERKALEAILPQFDLYDTAHDGPGGITPPASKKTQTAAKMKKTK